MLDQDGFMWPSLEKPPRMDIPHLSGGMSQGCTTLPVKTSLLSNLNRTPREWFAVLARTVTVGLRSTWLSLPPLWSNRADIQPLSSHSECFLG